MSLALLHRPALLGLQAPPVTVEVHLANGLPSFTNVIRQLDFGVPLPLQDNRPSH